MQFSEGNNEWEEVQTNLEVKVENNKKHFPSPRTMCIQ